MKRTVSWVVVVAALALAVAHVRAAKTLDLYFIDVEGGQSTLIVTPRGQTLLIDAGFPGRGTFQSKADDPHDLATPSGSSPLPATPG